MAIWDKILGRKEKPQERAAALPPRVPARRETIEPAAASSEGKTADHKDGKGGFGQGVLLAPHTTEKASNAAAGGAYIFRVAAGANKRAIASAVAGRYGVAVERVGIIYQPAKERRRGRQIGWKSGYKKAAVRLKRGQVIETL